MLSGKTETGFVPEAARRAAQDALPDQTLSVAGPHASDAFCSFLDAPPRPSERLRRTMSAKAPWDYG